MTKEKFEVINNLKEEIEKLTRVLLGGEGDFYIGNPEQNTHDYYRVDGGLSIDFRELLVERLHKLENEFKQY